MAWKYKNLGRHNPALPRSSVSQVIHHKLGQTTRSHAALQIFSLCISQERFSSHLQQLPSRGHRMQ
jgi:hypothetical protein